MKNCTAMIFAAGLGTRLYPLTESMPKALVKVKGKTLLEIAIQKNIDSGITHIVVNVHHFSEMMKEFLATHPFSAHIDISDESAQLLDTAGGLKFAEKFFINSDTILLYNVDILSNIDLSKFYEAHIQGEAMATLAVKNRESSRYLLFDEQFNLCGWRNVKSGEKKMVHPELHYQALAFSGIHFVNKEILALIPSAQKLSMTPLYLQIAEKYPVKGYLHDADTWLDVGKYQDWLLLNR